MPLRLRGTVLPTVPPIEPAWANAVVPANDAGIPDTNVIVIRPLISPILAMLHLLISRVLRVFAAASVAKRSD